MQRMAIIAAAALAAFLLLRHPASAPQALAAVPPAAVATRGPARRLSPIAAPVVYVVGAVEHAGLYRLAAGARAADALAKAGGFGPGADAAAINLAQRITDGEEILVPHLGEHLATPSPRRAGRTRSKRKAGSKSAAPTSPLNVNGANAAALATLPGIGTLLARRIVAYRRLNGPFASVDELADVAGMTQSRVDRIAPYLRVEGSP